MKGEICMAFDSGSLLPLLGKVVRVYKGGPESKVGRLIGVTASYALVDTWNEGITYYNMEHIKSVTEDLNPATYPPSSQSPTDDPTLLDFNAVLESLRSKLVRIDRGGPESRVGRLLGVAPDFFALWTKEDGILYYQTWHVKSISEVQKNQKNSDKNSNNDQSSDNDPSSDNEQNSNSDPLLNAPSYLEGYNLTALLGKLKNYWVKINRGGPESVEGVLTDVEGGFVTIVNNKEVYRIAISHIRNISYTDHNGILNGGTESSSEAQNGDSNNNGKDGKSNSNGKDGKSNSNGGKNAASKGTGSGRKTNENSRKNGKKRRSSWGSRKAEGSKTIRVLRDQFGVKAVRVIKKAAAGSRS
jgi:spore coat protein B